MKKLRVMGLVLLVTLSLGVIAPAWAEKEAGRGKDKDKSEYGRWKEKGDSEYGQRQGKKGKGRKGQKDFLQRLKKYSPEVYAQVTALEKEIKELAREYRKSEDADKAGIESQIKSKLGEVCDLMQEVREAHVQKMEEKLAELKEKVAEREANKDENVAKRLERILSGKGRKGKGNGFGNDNGENQGRGWERFWQRNQEDEE